MNAHSAIPRIDVDTASRDKLVAHIDELENLLSNAYPNEVDTARYQYAFGLTFAEAAIVAGLAKRGRATREYLRDVSFQWGDRNNIKNIDVLMVRIRRKLAPFNIIVGKEWGVGFLIDPDNLKLLRSILDERAAA
jgi:DNA-binding response OmpR family regulator